MELAIAQLKVGTPANSHAQQDIVTILLYSLSVQNIGRGCLCSQFTVRHLRTKLSQFSSVIILRRLELSAYTLLEYVKEAGEFERSTIAVANEHNRVHAFRTFQGALYYYPYY